VLGRDELVLHLVRLLLRRSKDLREPRAEILLPALDARKTSHGCLRVVENDSDIRAQLAEYWSNYTFGLLEHRDEQVLRLDLLVLVALGELDSGLNCFLPA
jgi:hypothetical protein